MKKTVDKTNTTLMTWPFNTIKSSPIIQGDHSFMLMPPRPRNILVISSLLDDIDKYDNDPEIQKQLWEIIAKKAQSNADRLGCKIEQQKL